MYHIIRKNKKEECNEEVIILTEELEYAFCGMCEEIKIMATEKVFERKKFNDIDELGIEVDNMIDKINIYDDKLIVFSNILKDIGFLVFCLFFLKMIYIC